MGLERKMQRRNAQALAKYARSLPQVDITEALRPGVTHMRFSHDDHCTTLKTGNGFDCDCSPGISFHREAEGK